ncbi:uncharacterized protein LOC105356683 isoform X2 [Oryzias latipes]|uniref:uncharacterized protein LOC105356683 isoform X2 n=1 Tax=Oryzias latipes TaxID=8090 RepID=UPI0005CB8943|nr:uncharacterized protein LOC105356683 isoform X2 [Oryzias latipes]
MITYQVKTPISPLNLLILNGSAEVTRRGPDAAERPTPRSMWTGAGPRRTHNSTKDETVQSDRRKDINSRPFLFDKPCMYMHKDTGLIPPLPRNLHLHKPATLHPLNLSKPMAKRHAGRPLPLSFILNGQNTFSGENCKFMRPKVNYPVYNPMTKYSQKSQSYPDPLVGAPCVFLQRITELSSLEGETLRQEKSKKRKSKKTS